MLTASISRSLSKSVCKNGPQSPKPALLMNRSTRRSSSALTSRRHSLFFERSAVMISQTVVSWSDSFSSRSARRATSSRLYPRAESWRANSAPMPELAPVMTANLGIGNLLHLQKRLPPRGKLSPKATDEGEPRRYTSFAGKPPLIRPCRPPSVYALRTAYGGCAPTRACGRSPSGKSFLH